MDVDLSTVSNRALAETLEQREATRLRVFELMLDRLPADVRYWEFLRNNPTSIHSKVLTTSESALKEAQLEAMARLGPKADLFNLPIELRMIAGS